MIIALIEIELNCNDLMSDALIRTPWVTNCFCIDWCSRKFSHSVSYFNKKYSNKFSTLYSFFFAKYLHEIQLCEWSNFIDRSKSIIWTYSFVGVDTLLGNNERWFEKHRNKNNWILSFITLFVTQKKKDNLSLRPLSISDFRNWICLSLTGRKVF